MTGRFKKDLKRYQNRPKSLAALKSVLLRLQSGSPLPVSCRVHYLAGAYDGCLECHVGPDFLLIWIEPYSDEVKLLRLGSHAELFR